MTAFTPNFAIPYQTVTDAPHGPNLGEDIAFATDTALLGLDARIDTLEAATHFTRIDRQILVGTAASITLPSVGSIPGTYSALRLLCMCRGDTAAAFTTTRLRFNADSGANYDSEQDSAAGSSATAFEALNATGADIGESTAASAVAGSVSIMDVSIPFYTNTTFWKSIISVHMLQGQTSGGQAGEIRAKQWVSRWRNTAAITSITILPGAGNFIAGSSFALYGIP